MKKIIDFFQRFTFPTIIALSALSVSGSAAFYSVTGLSKLFAGASFEVMVMAGSLEVAKLVIASLLYQYWGELNRVLKTYLTIAACVLVLITSAGIYGFLSSAYQETANKVGNIDAQVSLVETKRDNVQKQLNVYNTEKENIDKSIGDLRKGLSTNIITYTDGNGNLVTTTSSSTRKALQQQLDQAIDRQTTISGKIDGLNEQLFNYETEIVEISTNDDLAGEIGPLKYLSKLTGVSMDKIINWVLLVIIFVFDPLAIALVIAANFAYSKVRPPKVFKKEEPKEDIEPEIEDEGKYTPTQEDLEKLEQYLNRINEEKKKDEERLLEEIEKARYIPTEYDLEMLQSELDKIMKYKNNEENVEIPEEEIKLSLVEGENTQEIETENKEEETETNLPTPPKPIRRLIYQKRDGRNTRFDRF